MVYRYTYVCVYQMYIKCDEICGVHVNLSIKLNICINWKQFNFVNSWGMNLTKSWWAEGNNYNVNCMDKPTNYNTWDVINNFTGKSLASKHGGACPLPFLCLHLCFCFHSSIVPCTPWLFLPMDNGFLVDKNLWTCYVHLIQTNIIYFL